MDFEIKKGIPLPREKGRPRKYDIPLETMEVDDMVMVELPKTKIQIEQKIIRNFVLRYYFKKIDVLKRLDNLNKVGMNDYDVARTLKMDIRTIKGFRKGQNLQKRSFLKLLNGVIEIKKQLEELGKIV